MRKIIFCNIPMSTRAKISKKIYKSSDASVPTSDKAVAYPVASFLEETLCADDNVKVVLLVKKDALGNYKENISECISEFVHANEKAKAAIEYKIIESDFAEDQQIHDEMLMNIIDEFEDAAHVIADITYGPKDLPIVLFTALNFGEKFFNCEIDNIVYGQADFINGEAVNTKICDMVPLYYLNSITNTVNCTSGDKAKKMLKSLLSL